MRILRLANFWAPTSGGQRIALEETGRRYRGRGVEPVLLVPGPDDGDAVGPSGRVITVRSPRLPGTPYHLLTDLRRARDLLDQVAPDRLELSDRATLWPLAAWALEADVPTVLWAHERLEAILAPRVPRAVPLAAATRAWNRRILRPVERAVVPSAYVAAELQGAGLADIRVVPHGVDLDTFHPRRRAPASSRGVLLVWAGRLSTEKRPDLALAVLAELINRGRAARLLVVGDGAMSGLLRRRASGLPVTFTGHLRSREAMAHLLAIADVALATCPCEAFGLAALEALACGTPVVATASGALAEIVDPTAGRVGAGTPNALADAVETVLEVPAEVRTHLARRRAEQFTWEATVDGLLDAHGAPPPPGDEPGAPIAEAAAALDGRVPV